LDFEMKDIDREIEKTRKSLGDRGAEKPPRDASRAALREFIRLRELLTLHAATLISFGCADPVCHTQTTCRWSDNAVWLAIAWRLDLLRVRELWWSHHDDGRPFCEPC